MTRHRTVVRGLGEIGLRVNDLEKMQHFYEEVVGLEFMKRFPKTVFFRIGDGYRGHAQTLVLFDRSGDQRGPQITRTTPRGVSQERSTLDHLAFEIDLEAYEDEKRRLEDLGFLIETTLFDWTGWRSLYISDPEGNTVEFVCFDPSAKK